MAVTKAVDSGQRRFLFGLNVLLQIVLAAGVLAGVVALGQRFRTEVDTTRTAVNSLTPRTVKLLEGLKEPITLTAVYGVVKVDDQAAEKRRDMVRSLLSLYQRANPRMVSVQVIDPVKEPQEVLAELKRIHELPKYKEEAAPLDAALKAFPELSRRIGTLVKDDVEVLKPFENANIRLKIPGITSILRDISQKTANITEDLSTLQSGDLPQQSAAADLVRTYLTTVRAYFDDMKAFMGAADARKIAGETPGLREAFEQLTTKYDGMLTEIDQLSGQLKDIKRTPLDEIDAAVTRSKSNPVILIRGPTEARMAEMNKVWPFATDQRPGGGPAGDGREFAGEQALSSAILQLAQTERTAVVFVRYGGPVLIQPQFNPQNPMQMERAPYQELSNILERANFIVKEWDLEAEKVAPTIAEAKRVIYFVLPLLAPPPPQQNPMRPTPPPSISDADRQILLDAVNTSGMALLLCGWRPSASPTMPMAPYELADYLKATWGIDVQSPYLAFRFSPLPDKPGRVIPTEAGTFLATPDSIRFTDHPIGRPAQFQQIGFLTACPLGFGGPTTMPAGVRVETIVETVNPDFVWALRNPEARFREAIKDMKGLAREADDVAAPFPIGVAALNEKGQRVVVFSSVQFCADEIALSAQNVLLGNQLVRIQPFAANDDLILNSLYWLSNDADRISVGAKVSEIPRLSRLKSGASVDGLKVGLVGVLPALVLMLGGIVWLRRRV